MQGIWHPNVGLRIPNATSKARPAIEEEWAEGAQESLRATCLKRSLEEELAPLTEHRQSWSPELRAES